jgi:peptide-methionine (S)-S-oxide reductase
MSDGNGNVTPEKTEKATFGAGCFWQVEENFRALDGVVDTAAGYEGGDVENPTYEQVCSGATGHVEVVEVEYDPAKVSYETLVETYFSIHDPTQLNRQGPDVGYQYRSVIFAHTDDQAEGARKVLERTQERFSSPVVTAIEPAKPFWRAEEYHQCYLEKRRSGGLIGQLLGR